MAIIETTFIEEVYPYCNKWECAGGFNGEEERKGELDDEEKNRKYEVISHEIIEQHRRWVFVLLNNIDITNLTSDDHPLTPTITSVITEG